MTAQSDLSRYRGEANRFRADISRASAAVAAQRKKAADATAAASRSRSETTIRMRLSEAERATKSANDAESKRATLEKRLADVELKITRVQGKYEKEQRDARSKGLDSIRRETRSASEQFTRPLIYGAPSEDPLVSRTRAPSAMASSTRPQSDVFLSHASEDKDDIARPLKVALGQRGLDVWFDEIRIKPGSSIRKEIEAGIANARFGVVILSPHFFLKEWTQAELDGLFGRKLHSGQNLIIPVWHHVSKDEVLRRSPMLADIAALNSAVSTVEEIADRIAEVVRPAAA